MALDRKLTEWQAAGLIDASTAAAIAAHEAAEARPIARWAAIAIGLLALALGATLVVAANWDIFPRGVKLGAHFVALVAAGATVWLARERWLREGALFLFGALILAGLALQGQVYQLPGSVHGLLGAAGLLAAPAILLAGTTRLTAIGWSLLLAAAAIAYVSEVPRDAGLLGVLPAALPPGLVLLSSLIKDRPSFALGLRDGGLALLLLGASLAHFAWAVRVSPDDAWEMVSRLPLALLLCVGGAVLSRDFVVRTALVVVAVAVPLAIAIPHADALWPRLVGAVLFLGVWALIARVASEYGWRTLFGLAIAAIAVRLFIIYFELFGSLASTGLGLIGGGALLIALAVAWDRIVRRRRPA